MPGVTTGDGEEAAPPEDASTQDNLPVDGAEWVELFVREMMSALSIDDASSRATRVLESLERSISARAGAEAAEIFHKVGNNYSMRLPNTLICKSSCGSAISL